MNTAQILILKTGTTNPPVVAEFGDYDDWFQTSLSSQDIHWHVVSVYKNQHIPNLESYDGIVITGSPSSVYEHEEWMNNMCIWLKERIKKQDIPILAVCFGHQILGQALGGAVQANPQGRENGTISIQLNKKGLSDPLFHKLPTHIEVQSVHMDIITALPQNPIVENLGSTSMTTMQALQVGPMIRSVQFHPEIHATTLSRLFEVRSLEAEVFHTEHGKTILENWFAYWIAKQF